MTALAKHSATQNSEAKTHALVAYILLVVGLFTAIPMLFGAVWAMIKKRQAVGTVYHSHYRNAIRTFWWTLGWSIIGAILIVVMIGYAIICAVWLWALYRLVNGLAKIMADEPYPI